MADTRCANPAYQLEADEMVLEYLVYNTLKAHIDEWNPDYRNTARSSGHKVEKASKLLSTLDTIVHLFKAHHPHQNFSSSTEFYLKLLEFLLLFTHQRGGPSTLSEASNWTARNAGKTNIERRARYWRMYEGSQQINPEDEDLLATRLEQYVGTWLSVEDDHGASYAENFKGVPLVDLLPRFMDLSAQIAQLIESGVSEMWLELANDFMLQAAIEVGLTSPISSYGPKIDHEALLACFGWGLPTGPTNDVSGDDGDCHSTEDAIHEMLLPRTSESSSSWIERRRQTVSEFMKHIQPESEEAQCAYMHEDDMRHHFSTLLYDHPMDKFEIQMLDCLRNLQMVWTQLTEEPILLQIEQGGLKGLDDDEFQAFMDRVGSDEHEERLQNIKVSGISKI